MIQRSIIGMLSVLIVFFATCGNKHTASFMEEKNVVALCDELTGDEQEDQNNNPVEYKLMAYEAVLPLLQANFSPLQYTFFKITIIIENVIEEERVFHLPFISYFNTLFRLIISPNAP